MGPKRRNNRSENNSDMEMESVVTLAQMFENQMQIMQRNNAELLKNLSVNLSSTVAELGSQVLSGINDLKSVVVADRKVDTSEANENARGNVTENEMSQSQRCNIRNSNFITAFKDLGGTNIIFRPGESSTHPVSFIRNLETVLDDAGVPHDKRVSFALKTLKGSAADWAYIKKDLFVSFDVFKTMFMSRYWNIEKQREMFAKLKYGHYTGGSRADYFIKLVKEATYLDHELSEKEIIKMLAGHFNYDVKRGILSAAYQTIDDVEQHLRELDEMLGEQNGRGTSQSNWRQSNTGNNNNNGNSNSYQLNNNRSYNVGRATNQNSFNSTPHTRERVEARVEDRDGEIVNRNGGSREQNSRVVATLFDKNSDFVLEEDVNVETDKSKVMPVLEGCIENVHCSVLIDSGSQLSCISQNFYKILKERNGKLPVLPVSNIVIVGALKGKQQVAKEQILLQFNMQGVVFENVCVVVPGLSKSVILGCDWMIDYKITICFDKLSVKGWFQGKELSLRFVESIREKNSLELTSNESEMYDVEVIEEEGMNVYDEKATKGAVEHAECLNDENKQQLHELIDEFRDLFSDKPGQIKGYEHKMELKDTTGFYIKPYPIPVVFQREVQRQIDEMINWGIIEKKQTEYVSPLVVVKKKDGSPRICIDARYLNQRLVRDYVIPPNPYELLCRFTPGQVMSVLDLAMSYWQIKMKETDQKYTGFAYNGETYVFKVLPFGLVTSVASFIRGLNTVLGEEVKHFVIPYVDDILVTSPNAKEHLKHLKIIFTKFRHAGVTLKLKKCNFAKAQVSFIGHIITPSGVCMEPSRVRTILEYKVPTNVKSLRAFLGLINYDHRFVKNFANLTLDLNKLLKKGTKWSWGDREQRAFETVKTAFNNVVMLNHPNPEWDYFINTDASEYAIGACLYQLDEEGNNNVIAYFSRVLRGPERNYCITEKEALAIVSALRHWRIIILGHNITVVTDHKALSFLKQCRLLSGRLTRWSLYLQEFALTICYCQGKDNIIADILSRYPDGENPMLDHPSATQIEINALHKNKYHKEITKCKNQLMLDQRVDPFCKSMIEELEKENPSERCRKWFIMYEDLLFRRGTENSPGYRLCVPKTQIEEIINHEHRENGHFGCEKCYLALVKEFYWPKMQRTIRRVVGVCDLCQKSKISVHCHGEMRSVLASRPNEIVSIDLMGPLPVSRAGATQLLVILDIFSKHVALYALRRATSKAILNRLTKFYIPNIGKPKIILSDNGTQFRSKLFLSTLTELGIKSVHTSVYYPQGNMVERVNREIGRMLRAYCHAQHQKWACMLGKIEMWLNRVVHSSTGFSADEVHFGKKYKHPLIKNINFPPYNEKRVEIIELAHENLRSKAEKRKQRYTKQCPTSTSFKPGDKVLVKSHKLSSNENKEIKKFFLLFEGPCTVQNQINENAYLVTDDASGKSLGLQNVYNLKPYKQANLDIE